jgi:hypothetical protein
MVERTKALVCNHIAIPLQRSLSDRFATYLQSFNIFDIAFHPLRNGFAIALQSRRSRLSIALSSLCHRSAIDTPSVWN